MKKVSIDTIQPYDKNAKEHPKKQVQQIADSIDEFGFNQPIVVDTDGVIIVGHGRLLAAQQLGLNEVPVLEVDLTPEQAKAYRLADNKLNESGWDMDLVIEELKGLDDDMVELTGFDLDLTLEEDEKDDEVPETPEEPEAELGQIYKLGEHRVMCGDATDEASVEKLMDGEKADMVFTDPPYGMNLDTDYSQMPGTSSKYKKVEGDDKDFDASILFGLIDAPIWYLWGADYYCDSIPNYKDGSYIVWSKSQSENENSVIGSRFELCWVYPKQKKNVWFERSINQSSERTGEHPTQKPTALATRAFQKSSKVGELVLDLFLGSGSTLIAAEKTGRKCYGMELDPKYIDVIIKRWEDYTGNKAELIS